MNRRLIEGEILPLCELKGMVTPQEWHTSMQMFKSTSRRCEWLSWRAHLRQSLSHAPFCGVGDDVQIEYTPHGAPQIIGHTPRIYIAVTHSRSRVGVLLSDHPCGIDMEIISRNFERASSRYLSPVEYQVAESMERQLFQAIAWSTKEAAYKYAATPGLDLLRDITIKSLNPTTQQIIITIQGTLVNCHYRLSEDHVVVTI